MRRKEDREAVQLYAQAKAMLDESGVDRLQPEARLTIVRQGNVVTVGWRPYSMTENVLVGVDGGAGDPAIVSFHRGGWTTVLKRCV